MIVTNGHLVMASTRASHIFRVFPLPLTGENFCDVREGRGPGEVVGLDYKSLAAEGDGFWFMDAAGARKGTFSSHRINITRSFYRLQPTDTKNGFIQLRDGYLDINTDGSDKEYVLYDKTLVRKTPIGKYPKWDRSGQMLNLFTYIKFLAVKPSKDRFVAAYGRFPKIRIMTSKVSLKKEVDLNVSKKPLDPNFVYYLSKPCVNDSYICIVSQGGVAGNTAPELQILDWNGRLLKRFTLDNRVDLFAVDFENWVIYTYSHESPGSVFSSAIPDLSR